MRTETWHCSIPLHWFGNLVAGVCFNSVTPLETEEFRYFRKCRFRIGSSLAWLANRYAARTGIRMRVLSNAAWLRHEALMYRLLLGRRVIAVRGALLLPRLPGRNLLSLLQENRPLNEQSQLGLSLAVRELARVHTRWTPHPLAGELQLFSHADATVENVVVDLEKQSAHWLDFETTHESSLPAPVRHADDLLTFLCSAAAVVEMEALPRLCQRLLQGYQSRPVVEAMWKLIASWERLPMARQLAFPALNASRWRLLSEAALAAASQPTSVA